MESTLTKVEVSDNFRSEKKRGEERNQEGRAGGCSAPPPHEYIKVTSTFRAIITETNLKTGRKALL